MNSAIFILHHRPGGSIASTLGLGVDGITPVGLSVVPTRLIQGRISSARTLAIGAVYANRRGVNHHHRHLLLADSPHSPCRHGSQLHRCGDLHLWCADLIADEKLKKWCLWALCWASPPLAPKTQKAASAIGSSPLIGVGLITDHLNIGQHGIHCEQKAKKAPLAPG